MRDDLPLRPGSSGPSVVTLQQRLVQMGLTTGDDDGSYGDGTVSAVRVFQERRGLRIDGICGRDTWASMEEASYQLGDRLLFHRSPMLRGDDIAELQTRLGGLGFDAGRVDGIFGPDTAGALTQFQRNAGTVADGICGPDTLAALRRVGGHVLGSVLATVREEEQLRGPGSEGRARVLVGCEEVFDLLGAGLAEVLSALGAEVLLIPPAEPSAMATVANAMRGHLYVHLAPAESPGVGVAYYSFEHFTSLRGKRLAELILQAVPEDLLGPRRESTGMRLTVLRETKMPAVHLEFGPLPDVLRARDELIRAVANAVVEWSTTPPPGLAASHPGSG